MEDAVRERFERIEAILHAMAERENQMEIRFAERHAKWEARMDRVDARMDRMDAHMEKHDRQIAAIQKLVQTGMKMLVQIQQGQKKTDQALRELAASQQAFINSLRKGTNGRRA